VDDDDALMVKCKGCYAAFPAPEQLDHERFTDAEFPTGSLKCPHCGIGRPYDKGDYYFASQEGPKAPWL
jgi:hypothetical protein